MVHQIERPGICPDHLAAHKLCILLPVTSRDTNPDTILERLRSLATGLGSSPATSICVGLDEGDDLQRRPDIEATIRELFQPHDTVLVVWSKAQLEQLEELLPPFPLCWMWGQLAAAAVEQLKPSLLVLLGRLPKGQELPCNTLSCVIHSHAARQQTRSCCDKSIYRFHRLLHWECRLHRLSIKLKAVLPGMCGKVQCVRS